MRDRAGRAEEGGNGTTGGCRKAGRRREGDLEAGERRKEKGRTKREQRNINNEAHIPKMNGGCELPLLLPVLSVPKAYV